MVTEGFYSLAYDKKRSCLVDKDNWSSFLTCEDRLVLSIIISGDRTQCVVCEIFWDSMRPGQIHQLLSCRSKF